MNEYRPLQTFRENSDRLRKLISENPDLPIVVICDSEVIADDSYSNWYAPEANCHIGELLDEENIQYNPYSDEEYHVYVDRDELEEDIQRWFEYDDNMVGISDEEWDKAIKEELKRHEPYWRKVIFIHAAV